MLLTIYDKAGAKRADVAASDSSTQSKEVQGDNVLALSFTHYAHIPPGCRRLHGLHGRAVLADGAVHPEREKRERVGV